jgi:hypothetical protein
MPIYGRVLHGNTIAGFTAWHGFFIWHKPLVSNQDGGQDIVMLRFAQIPATASY